MKEGGGILLLLPGPINPFAGNIYIMSLRTEPRVMGQCYGSVERESIECIVYMYTVYTHCRKLYGKGTDLHINTFFKTIV